MAGITGRPKQTEFICDVCHKAGLGNVNQKRHRGECSRQKIAELRSAAKDRHAGLVVRLALKDGTLAHATLPNNLLKFSLTKGLLAVFPNGSSRRIQRKEIERLTVSSVIGINRIRRVIK
jgi:hypothetical protein